MERNELKALKEHIVLRIETLEALLAGDKERDGEQSDDESAKMDMKISSAVKSRISQAERQELARLRSNLIWLDKDDAGCCEECGREIPYPRLKAVPTTRFCIDCVQNQ